MFGIRDSGDQAGEAFGGEETELARREPADERPLAGDAFCEAGVAGLSAVAAELPVVDALSL